MKFCPRDRTPNPDNAIICVNPACGFALPVQKSGVYYPPRPPVVAAPPAKVAILGSPVTLIPAIVTVLEGGRDGAVRFCGAGPMRFGRTAGDLQYPGDPHVSTEHASIELKDGRAVLVDLGGANGTFVRLNDKMRIADGMEFLVGHTLLRWKVQQNPVNKTMLYAQAVSPVGMTLEVVPSGGRPGVTRALTGSLSIGRRGADVALDDPFM